MFFKKETRRFFFTHIPKTGGTSFRNLLYPMFRAKHVLSNKKDLVNNDGRYLPLHKLIRITPERLENCHLLIGHLPLVATELLDNDPNLLVFLRNPVDRAVSNLLHIQRHELPELSLKQVLDLPGQINRVANNLQTRMLSFQSIEEAITDWNTLKVDHARLEQARESLSNFAFIGITERFDESVALCEAKFDWKFRTKTLRQNVSPNADDELEPVRERIEEEVRFDQELYAHGCSLFEARLSQSG